MVTIPTSRASLASGCMRQLVSAQSMNKVEKAWLARRPNHSGAQALNWSLPARSGDAKRHGDLGSLPKRQPARRQTSARKNGGD